MFRNQKKPTPLKLSRTDRAAAPTPHGFSPTRHARRKRMRSMKRRGRLSTPSRKDLRFLKPRCHERGHRAFGAQGVTLCGLTSFMLPDRPRWRRESPGCHPLRPFWTFTMVIAADGPEWPALFLIGSALWLNIVYIFFRWGMCPTFLISTEALSLS